MRVVRSALRVLSALAVVGLLVLAVTAFRVVLAGRTDGARAVDAIVVMGAAQFDGVPQGYLTARLEHARDLYRAGTAPVVVTLGGRRPGDRFTEAEAGRTWLTQHDVAANDVVAVGEGSDTLTSAQALAEQAKQNRWHSVVVVTDPWHELRATTMVTDLGLAAYGSPVPDGPSRGSGWHSARYVARETIAYLAYEVRELSGRTST